MTQDNQPFQGIFRTEFTFIPQQLYCQNRGSFGGYFQFDNSFRKAEQLKTSHLFYRTNKFNIKQK